MLLTFSPFGLFLLFFFLVFFPWFSVGFLIFLLFILFCFLFLCYFKCQMTIQWSMLSSSAASWLVVRESASMIALGCSLSTSSGHAVHLWESRLCKTSWTTTSCTFISSSWSKCIVDVASCLRCFMTHFKLK